VTLQVFNANPLTGAKLFEWVVLGVVTSGALDFVYTGSSGGWKPAAPNIVVEEGLPLALRTGLLAYYRMEEATGSPRMDSSGNELSLNSVAAVSRATGKLGYAASFNGTTQYLSCGVNPFAGLGQFYISAWVRTSTNVGQAIIGVEGSMFFGMEPDADGALGLQLVRVSGGNVAICNGPTVPHDGDWHFVAGAYDGLALYTSVDNGGPVGAGATGTIDAGTGVLRIGTDVQNRFMNGQIDALGIWNRILTEEETAELYNGGAGREYPFTS
jgi:hypothetical protein